MKTILRAISILAVTVGVLSYGAYLLTGRVPWQDFKGFKKPSFSLPKQLSIPGKKADNDLIYKWQDAEGVWQFSNEPPPDHSSYEQLEVNPNTNVVVAVPAPQEEEEPDNKELENPEESKKPGTESPYSPEGIQKLMDEARSVQEKLNERTQEQKELLDKL